MDTFEGVSPKVLPRKTAGTLAGDAWMVEGSQGVGADQGNGQESEGAGMTYNEIVRLKSELATVKAELEEARQDANSWRQQCDDRVADVLRIAAERDKLNERLEFEQFRTTTFNDITGLKANYMGEVTDIVMEIKAERDRLAAENKWHPASEPPDNSRDVWCHGTIDERGYCYDGRWMYYDDDGHPMIWTMYLPTHWRELPRFTEAELPGAKVTPSPHQRDELPRRGD